MYSNRWNGNGNNFNNFGGWNSNMNQNFPDPGYEENMNQEFPDPGYEQMDEEFSGNSFQWQNNRPGGGPPRMEGFNPRNVNWDAPPNSMGPHNMFGWQNNGPGGGSPRNDWRPFNPGPVNWNHPSNFVRNPPKMYGWGRGFGPSGPPVQKPNKNKKPIEYLLRCGIAKERVKNLPRDFLRLIAPGHCGLCEIALASFSLSRAHYASKAHMKKQNVWMAEYRNLMSQHPKTETPLKSRDLYCELCDVEITSKVHADSHYDGKHHRAIVEGRKKPKNTTLHTENFADRLKLLIRREKKFIKPLTEVEKSEEEIAQKRALQPELYCEICKTAVTCTDQMTMHLNGKKHLTKEKLHILNVMKNDGKNDDKAEEGAEGDAEGKAEVDAGDAKGDAEKAAKEEASENAEAEIKEQVEDGGNCDWDNDGGAWDEDEKQEEK